MAEAVLGDPGANAAEPGDRLMLQDEVSEATCLARTQIWRLRRQGEFPEPIELTSGKLAWWRSEVMAWLRSRPRRSVQGGDNG